MNRFISAEPFPPGEYIQEELDARGWTQGDLASVLKISLRQVANLIAGKSAISPETAAGLGAAFGQDPVTWMNLQVSYELALEAKKDRDTAKRAAIYNKVPVREMKKRCWLPDTDDTPQLADSVCRFLEIKEISDTPEWRIAARKSTAYGHETASQLAWYARARQLAQRAPASRFNPDDFESGVANLRTLASCAENARRIPAALGEMGVRLVLVQHLTSAKVDGVAFWLDDSSPAIALSLRFDRMDNLWFNLMHELVHIKHQHAAHIDADDAETGGEVPVEEVVANREGADYLVPNSKLESFIKRMKPLYYQERIIQFAQSQGVHPAIVVGQLHNRGELKPFQLRKLLVPIKEYILGQAITDGWGNDLWLG